MDLTWERIVTILFFCGAVIKWGVPQIKVLADYIESRRKAKRELEQADKSTTADLKRIENESEEAHLTRLNTEIRELRAELKEIKDSPSLSFATRTKWYQKYRKLGVEIDQMETKVSRELPHKVLLTSLVQVKKSYDELGETMP